MGASNSLNLKKKGMGCRIYLFLNNKSMYFWDLRLFLVSIARHSLEFQGVPQSSRMFLLIEFLIKKNIRNNFLQKSNHLCIFLQKLPIERSSHAISIIGETLYLFGGENVARVPIDSSIYVVNISPNASNFGIFKYGRFLTV